MTERTLTEIHADGLKRRTEKIVAGLRHTADAVERLSRDLDRVPSPGIDSYSSVVANIQNEILWGLANLHLSEATRDAGEADRAMVEES